MGTKMTMERQITDKVVVARNATLRTKQGGYAQIVEDSVLKQHVYLKKYTVMTVISISLYTQTILAVDSATKQTYSLDYDFILENCEIIKQPNSLVDAVSIVNVSDVKSKKDYFPLFCVLTGVELVILVSIVALLNF